jgi:hypothetical protein
MSETLVMFHNNPLNFRTREYPGSFRTHPCYISHGGGNLYPHSLGLFQSPSFDFKEVLTLIPLLLFHNICLSLKEETRNSTQLRLRVSRP